METYYLIDFENVKSDGLKGCEKLTEKDHIIIFFTENAKKLDMSKIANNGKASLEMISVPVGKQSADIHISSYTGYLVGQDVGAKCNIVIVSEDTDYDNVIRFWRDRTKISVLRKETIDNKKKNKEVSNDVAVKSPNKTVINNKTKLNQDVMQAISNSGYAPEVANNVAHIVAKSHDSNTFLSEVHNALKEKYTDYNDVYKIIKPILTKHNVSKDKDVKKVSSKDRTVINAEIMKRLSSAGFSNDIVTYVASTAVKNLNVKNGKQQTYRTIVSKFGQGKGLNIYNQIKKII